MKVIDYLKTLSSIKTVDREMFVESLKIKNYGSNELTEHEMWILTNASENAEYLERKLKEAELSLDTEAPAEGSSSETDGEELSLDAPAEETPATDGEELSLDTPTEETPVTDGEELSLDAPAEETPATDGEELSLDTPTDDSSEEEKSEEKENKEIETSLEGIGILPLLGEIQDKLANGKPSEVELAALKALKKLV